MVSTKAAISLLSTTIKMMIGTKKYYVAIGGAMMTSFMLVFIVSWWPFKVFFLVNAIGLFVLVMQNEERADIFEAL
jgi:hypothetical protein